MSRVATTLALLGLLAGCRSLLPLGEERLRVKDVQEEIVLAAWSEPSSLPSGGGQVQILVRVQRRGGTPFPGVEVRLAASTGTLYSGGRVLVTDARGMTRDRLTTRRSARITLNAGGTRYRFDVRVGEGWLERAAAQRRTAMPWISKRAPRNSGPEPMNARAGKSLAKYERYVALNTS